MNCLECQELLQKRLDGESVSAPAFEQHLSECASCRELHTGAVCLLEGLKQMPQVNPPPGFAAALASQIVHERKQRRDKLRRRIVLTLALAASVMLLLVAAFRWIPRPGPHEKHPGHEIAKDNNKSAPPLKNVPPEKTPEPKRNEPRNALTQLTDRIADTTRDHAQVVLVGTNLDAVEKLPADLPMIDPSMREAGQEVSDSVRSVTRTTRKAFDFFARELPMPEASN
jgi:hypothetical protein